MSCNSVSLVFWLKHVIHLINASFSLKKMDLPQLFTFHEEDADYNKMETYLVLFKGIKHGMNFPSGATVIQQNSTAGEAEHIEF